MATTHNSQSTNGLAIDTAVAGTSMNALANAGYALGAAIDNRPTDGTTISYDIGYLTITTSSAISVGAGSPGITVWILPAVDATNYPTPPGGSAAAAPLGLSYSFPAVPSVSSSTFVSPPIPLPPFLFKVQFQNNLGVAFPSTNTSTCQLQRTTTANW